MYKLTIFFTFTIFLLPSGCFAMPLMMNSSKYILRFPSKLTCNGGTSKCKFPVIEMYDNIELSRKPILTLQLPQGLIFKGKQLCKWGNILTYTYKSSKKKKEKEKYNKYFEFIIKGEQGRYNDFYMGLAPHVRCMRFPIVKSHNKDGHWFWLEFDDVKNNIYISKFGGQKVYYKVPDKYKKDLEITIPARVTMKMFLKKNPDLGKFIDKLKKAAKQKNKKQLIKLGIRKGCLLDAEDYCSMMGDDCPVGAVKDCFILSDKFEEEGGMSVYDKVERLLDFSKVTVEYNNFNEVYKEKIYSKKFITLKYELLRDKLFLYDHDDQGNYSWKADCHLNSGFEKPEYDSIVKNNAMSPVIQKNNGKIYPK